MQERLFKAEMILQGDTYETLSNYLGIVRQTLYRKIKDGSFTQTEMSMIKARWNLNNEKFSQLFAKDVTV